MNHSNSWCPALTGWKQDSSTFLTQRSLNMSPQDLKSVLQKSTCCPSSDRLRRELRFAPKAYADRLEWLQPYGASAPFAAGGTGEFFSLEPGEYSEVIKVALAHLQEPHAIIAGAGGSTTLAIKGTPKRLSAWAPRAFAAAPLPDRSQPGRPDRPRASRVQEREVWRGGLQPWRLPPDAHQPASAGRHLPQPDRLQDGFGDIEKFVSIRQTLGDRFAYLGGLPTAELFAGAFYKAMGCPVYSSAVFTFIPKTAMEFYNAHAANDTETCNRLIRDFFIPYIALHQPGVKATPCRS